NPIHFLLALLGAVLIHAGTNLVNDYYDFKKGVDNATVNGPKGMIVRGKIRPREVIVLGAGCFVAGAAVGLLLVALTGLPLLWLGLASVAAGFFYTGAPISLAYVALGE